MGSTACTEPQCLYKGALYLYLYRYDPFAKPKRRYLDNIKCVRMNARTLVFAATSTLATNKRAMNIGAP